jgi:transposase
LRDLLPVRSYEVFLVIDILESSACDGEKNSDMFTLRFRCKSRYDKKILRVRDLSVAGWRIYLEFERWRVKCPQCITVHVEHLDWLANNPRYTQRFAMHVGNLCRDMTVSRVAEIERLHHSTVKDLDKLYMRRQVGLAGMSTPREIGVD